MNTSPHKLLQTVHSMMDLIIHVRIHLPGKHSVVVVANNDDVLVSYRINETLKPAGEYVL